MTRIVGHLSTFNSTQFVAKVLIPIHRYLDELIIVDGAWRVYVALGYYKRAWSTDGTKELIESLNLKCPWKWIPAPKFGWESHAEKCAEHLKYLKKGDWQYYLNDDEVPSGRIRRAFVKILEMPQEITRIEVPFEELLREPKTWISRFFKWRRGIHYGYTHCDLRTETGENFRDWACSRVDEMRIIHYKYKRDPHMLGRTDRNTVGRFTDVHLRGSEEALRKIILAGVGKNGAPQ